MSVPAFSLRIFVADGDPDGLRIVERSNWIGKAVIFPRSVFPKAKSRSEFSQTGVYLLVGPREDEDGDILYIGEGDPVRPRLESHFAKKDFWTHAVFFVGGTGQLNKAHVQYLEAQLIQRAKSAKRIPLDNRNEPSEPSLSEADRAYMEVFLENMLSILPVLGIHAFEQSMPAAPTKESDAALMPLYCRGNGVAATGFESSRGFTVKLGSYAKLSEAPSISTTISKMRRELLKSGVLVSDGSKLKFTQDFAFNSPSLAAATVLGRNTNGRTKWRDADGKTLKQIQSEQAELG